jgi:hypothetical protein
VVRQLAEWLVSPHDRVIEIASPRAMSRFASSIPQSSQGAACTVCP